MRRLAQNSGDKKEGKVGRGTKRLAEPGWWLYQAFGERENDEPHPSKLQSSFKVPCLDQELLSNTAASQSCWCETHLTVDTDSCLPAASKSLHNCFWWFLVDSWPSWPVFSQQQVIVSVFFLIEAVTQLCHVLYTHKQLLYSSSWDL